jgi:hypothetical protein
MARRVRWFSEGAASAIATKLDLIDHGIEAGPVVCISTGSEDDDNHRFRVDCEKWFGCQITLLKSEKYGDTWDVWEERSFMAGINGAVCSRELKFVVRLNFEEPTDCHVFGYTADPLDRKRANRLREDFSPLGSIVTPLIDRHITKANCRALLASVGIAEPRTYALGFPNANCLKSGCVKATSPSYWALHRKHFPEGFARTAALARKLGVRLAIIGREKGQDGKVHNVRAFIDDIPANWPTTDPIAPSCDLLCSVNVKDLAA